MKKRYTVGMDYGTLSVRTVLMDALTGEELAKKEMSYPHGVMDRSLPDGTSLPSEFALQHPEDYLLGLSTVKEVLSLAGVDPAEVAALAIDFTTCTLLSVDGSFTPLCMKKEFNSEPHSYVKLWKHHAAIAQTERINQAAKERSEPWLATYGGKISCEWALPKILETLECAPKVFENTHRFLEAGDWLSYVLTGEETHAAAFAGFKALWNAEDGYPSDDFLRAVDPRLEGLFGTKLSDRVVGAGAIAGRLSERGAEWTGLLPGTLLAPPMIDAQASMPALNAVGEGKMMMVIGTSCCHIMNSRRCVKVPGIAGFVKDAVLDGMVTYEAGQSGAGDCFDWFVKNFVGADYRAEAQEKGMNIHALLRSKAQNLQPGESGLIALDWVNGNRSILCDHSLSGLFLGMTLSTRPEEMYRALIEATAFGTRKIIEQYETYGVEVKDLCAAGGIPGKDPMLMQIFADVLGRPIRFPEAGSSAARGSAIVAAVAAGIYPDLTAASEALAPRNETVYTPKAPNVSAYNELYQLYCGLHDLFGKERFFMRRLRDIAAHARGEEE